MLGSSRVYLLLNAIHLHILKINVLDIYQQNLAPPFTKRKFVQFLYALCLDHLPICIWNFAKCVSKPTISSINGLNKWSNNWKQIPQNRGLLIAYAHEWKCTSCKLLGTDYDGSLVFNLDAHSHTVYMSLLKYLINYVLK